MAGSVEALNRIMDTYKERCKCLEDITKDGVLQMTNVIQAQEIYIEVVSELVATLNARMEEFKDPLPLDEKYIIQFSQSIEEWVTDFGLKISTKFMTGSKMPGKGPGEHWSSSNTIKVLIMLLSSKMWLSVSFSKAAIPRKLT